MSPATQSQPRGPGRRRRAGRSATFARSRVEPLESRTLLSVAPATLSPAIISGVHFNDINSNGDRDPGEEGQPGWVVFIDDNQNGRVDTGEYYTTTAGDGSYTFALDAFGVVQPGTHTVSELPQDLWVRTAPPNGSHTVTVTLGQTLSGVDFAAHTAVPDVAPAPAGEEFRANTFTNSNQFTLGTASDAVGNFVITWGSEVQDGSGFGVYAQRYDSTGAKVGGEFVVNTYTANNQLDPAIAMDADGDFVISWQSYAQDGSLYGIYAQRFNSAGVKQGTEFRVNTFTAGHQLNPAVAMDADGDFVVTWQSYQQEGTGDEIYAQRYSASGSKRGGEVRVNTFTAGDQSNSTVAMNASGNFVVAWQSSGQEGTGDEVYVQRFTSAGTRQGTPVRVNTSTYLNQGVPAAAMDATGDFVITWYSNGQDGSDDGVFAQRYNASGVPQGGEVRVNTFTAGHQRDSAVAMDAEGNFVVAWGSAGQDGSGSGVYGRRFNAAGLAQESEFRANVYTNDDQWIPAAAMDRDGDFVIAWQSNRQDGNAGGIYARRYTLVRPVAPAVTQVFVNGPGLTGGTRTADQAAFRTLAGIDAAFGYAVPAGEVQVRSVPWVNGIDIVSIRFSQDVAGQIEQGDLQLRGVSTPTYAASAFAYDPTTRTAMWTLPSAILNDRVRLFLDDAGITGLDGEWQNAAAAESYPSGDGTAGGDFEFLLNVLTGDANGDGRVNALDLASIKQRLNRTAANPGSGAGAYSVFTDVTGDGSINALDLGALKRRLNARLPDPAAAGAPPTGAVPLGRRSLIDDFFSTVPIL